MVARDEAIEQLRESKQKPRKDFMLTGKGKASDFFDVETSKDTLARYTDQDGAPTKNLENMNESEREKFLRDGELPPEKKAATKEQQTAEKPARPKLADFKAADGSYDVEKYEQALDRYEQQGKAADPETAAPAGEVPLPEGWTPSSLEEGIKTLKQRADADLKEHGDYKDIAPALEKLDGNGIADGLRFMQFMGNALAMLKHPGNVARALALNPNFFQRIKHDWQGAVLSGDSKYQAAHQKMIVDALRMIDDDAKAFPGGKKPREVPTLTRANGVISEPRGTGSSPADEVEAAIQRGDGERYRELMNQRDREKWRAKHGRPRR
jgi:hypothetical protein